MTCWSDQSYTRQERATSSSSIRSARRRMFRVHRGLRDEHDSESFQ
jgi:hypothetical protein